MIVLVGFVVFNYYSGCYIYLFLPKKNKHVANIIPSFRLRSYNISRVTDWSINCHFAPDPPPPLQCHELFVSYITLISKDCVYLLDNGERPECIPCGSNYSLRHIFVDFVDVSDIRQTFYNVSTLSYLFTNITGDTILKFLKEINLYTKIYTEYYMSKSVSHAVST